MSVRFSSIEELEDPLPSVDCRRLPGHVAFVAGTAFSYRRKGGARASALPDFYIGADAAVEALTVLTCDGTRYRTYFPTVALVAPSR